MDNSPNVQRQGNTSVLHKLNLEINDTLVSFEEERVKQQRQIERLKSELKDIKVQTGVYTSYNEPNNYNSSPYKSKRSQSILLQLPIEPSSSYESLDEVPANEKY